MNFKNSSEIKKYLLDMYKESQLSNRNRIKKIVLLLKGHRDKFNPSINEKRYRDDLTKSILYKRILRNLIDNVGIESLVYWERSILDKTN